MFGDLMAVVQFWAGVLLIGCCALPLARVIFSDWFDRGYLMSKAVGMAFVTLVVLLLGELHLVRFGTASIAISVIGVFLVGVLLQRLSGIETQWHTKSLVRYVSLELFFFVLLLGWTYVKAHEPSIRSLEKFMDFGFVRTILNTDYFPPPDLWYAGEIINYYHFGHITLAVLTKLTGLDLTLTFNLMLALLFALCFSMSMGIGVQLSIARRKSQKRIMPLPAQSRGEDEHERGIKVIDIVAGLLTGFLVTLAGNMQTIYAFTKGYSGEDPPAFWTILYPMSEWGARFAEGALGLSNYWYANATRFIPFTIHEFPSYSFVVSDIHGHVLSIPYVLLITASILTYFIFRQTSNEHGTQLRSLMYLFYIGILVGMAFMTNALDGPIYVGLVVFLIIFMPTNKKRLNLSWIKTQAVAIAIVTFGWILGSLPFLLFFKSFVSGIAVNCPPAFLAEKRIGPILFETVDKCQKSPIWMMGLLWGFFWFCGGLLLVNHTSFIVNRKEAWYKRFSVTFKHTRLELVLVGIFLYCVLLIIFPEYFYFKDIYPAHFRSNTMFKLGYQAFILWSIIAGYSITKFLLSIHSRKTHIGRRILFFVLLAPQLFLVSIFPLYAIKSYFNNLTTYEGIRGDAWFVRDYPDDYAITQWMITEGIPRYQRDNVEALEGSLMSSLRVPNARLPIIVEADGESYTDYERVSVFAGTPTIVGWAVHEWLWRGSYDVVAPRREVVRGIYEADSVSTISRLVQQWNVTYIIVGKLEYEKYPTLRLDSIEAVATPVFQSGDAVVYKVL